MAVLDHKGQLASVHTDGNGHFAVEGLAAGVYQLVAAEGRAFFRVWSPKTTPPGARNAVLLVAGVDLVRGAPFPFNRLGGLGFGRLGGMPFGKPRSMKPSAAITTVRTR